MGLASPALEGVVPLPFAGGDQSLEALPHVVDLALADEVEVDIGGGAAGPDGDDKGLGEGLFPRVVDVLDVGDGRLARAVVGGGAGAVKLGRKLLVGGEVRLQEEWVAGGLKATQACLLIDDQALDEQAFGYALVGFLQLSDGAVGLPQLPSERSGAEQNDQKRNEEDLPEDLVEA